MNTQILKLKKELELIRKKNKGMLTPEKVVEYAKNKDTNLHSHFCWDNTKAADQYRLHQASCIIRDIKVTIITPKKETIRIREYVSLPADRGVKKGKSKGYRHIDQVLTEDDLRLQYIESVQKEFKAIQLKLKTISEFIYKKSEVLEKQIEKERQTQIRKVVSLKEAVV